MILEKQIHRAAYKSLFLKLFGSGANFLVGILTARLLGTSGFGSYSVILALVMLFALLSSLGLANFYTREVAISKLNQAYNEIGSLYNKSKLIVLATSIISIFFLFGLVKLGLVGLRLEDLTYISWIFALLIIPLQGINLLISAILRGLDKVIVADIPEIFIKPIILAISLSLFYIFGYEVNASTVLFLQFMTFLLAFLILSTFVKRELSKLRVSHFESFSNSRIKSDWITFLVISILSILQSQLPLYVASYYINPAAAGLYQSCVLVVNVLALGLTAVNSPLQPKLAEAWHKSNLNGVQLLIGLSVKLSTAISIFFSVIIFVFSDFILGLYGDEFLAAKETLFILLFGQLVNALCGPCAILLIVANRQRTVLSIYSISIVLGALLSGFLAPRLGITGVAIVYLAMMGFWNIAMVFICDKFLEVKTSIFQNLSFIR